MKWSNCSKTSRRTTSTRSSISSWTIIGTKSRISWTSQKNWCGFNALHSIQFRGENLSKIQILSLNSLARYRNYRMKSIAWLFREIVFRCWIRTQWTIPRCQSICVFLTSSSSWWDATLFYRNAEPQRRAAKHQGHAWCIFFKKSRCVIISTFCAAIEIHGVLKCRNRFSHQQRRRLRSKHLFKIWDASPDRQPQIRSSLVRWDFQRFYGADQTTTADFRSPFS